MRILFLGNNRVASQIVRWLRDEGEEIVGLVLHPPERRSFGSDIIKHASVASDRIFDGSELRRPEVVAGIRALNPDIGISVLFGYILHPEFIELFPAGCVNLHPALLPYNRGSFPNVWSIVDGTPAGATLHYIDSGIDTGDIIAQSSVDVEPVDTGESLYRKLEGKCLDLFIESWPGIRSGMALRRPQPKDVGTIHRVTDVERIDEIDLNRNYSARELLNVLRARTFPPFRGAYFVEGGRKVYVRVALEYERDE